MDVIIPFLVKTRPIKKLVIIDLKDDPIYKTLELQYFDGEPYGTGYRILGIRTDDYIDVYNDVRLNRIEGEKINEVGKGAKEWVEVDLKDVIYEKKDKGIHIYFNIKDLSGRELTINIVENRIKSTTHMSLLGPTVAGSKKPLFLPLFWVSEFDFLVKQGTQNTSTVDGKILSLAQPFVFPKDGQDRYFVKYAFNSYIIDFAPAEQGILTRYPLRNNHTVTVGPTIYKYEICEQEIYLKSLKIVDERFCFVTDFIQGIPISDGADKRFHSSFQIYGAKEFGRLEGAINGERKNHILSFHMCPSKGWKSSQKTMWDFIITNRFTSHAKWPKTFSYLQKINLKTLETEAQWSRTK